MHVCILSNRNTQQSQLQSPLTWHRDKNKQNPGVFANHDLRVELGERSRSFFIVTWAVYGRCFVSCISSAPGRHSCPPSVSLSDNNFDESHVLSRLWRRGLHWCSSSNSDCAFLHSSSWRSTVHGNELEVELRRLFQKSWYCFETESGILVFTLVIYKKELGF